MASTRALVSSLESPFGLMMIYGFASTVPAPVQGSNFHSVCDGSCCVCVGDGGDGGDDDDAIWSGGLSH